MANTNAEVAHKLVDAWLDSEIPGEISSVSDADSADLISRVEIALSTAQSNLAREVLKEFETRVPWKQPYIDMATERLRDLFTRMGVEVDG